MAKPTAKLDSGYRSAMADRAEVFRIFDLNHPPYNCAIRAVIAQRSRLTPNSSPKRQKAT
jgi:hypothetical protein